MTSELTLERRPVDRLVGDVAFEARTEGYSVAKYAAKVATR